MKTLIVTFYYPPEMGAAASRISNMAEGLRQRGVDVDVLTCLPNYPHGRIFEGYRGCLSRHEKLNGIDVFRYWTYATVSKNPAARFMGMLVFAVAVWVFGLRVRRIRRYDRVIIQSPPLLVAFSATVLFRCIYRRHTVLNVSDLWPLSAVELGAVKKGSTYYHVLSWMERVAYRHSCAYQGQSQEIIDHIAAMGHDKPHFLYRNLQPRAVTTEPRTTADRTVLRLVYAGLLGVAQDILGMIEHIDFCQVGAELHIYGAGNQADAIAQYAETHQRGVIYHGYKPKEDINQMLGEYHASVVPLAVSIKGAVPSKIFDLLPHGTPILFCGGGEGEQIVRQHGLGMVSAPGDYDALRDNIVRMKTMTDDSYQAMKTSCLKASQTLFSFDDQMNRYVQFLKTNQH